MVHYKVENFVYKCIQNSNTLPFNVLKNNILSSKGEWATC